MEMYIKLMFQSFKYIYSGPEFAITVPQGNLVHGGAIP